MRWKWVVVGLLCLALAMTPIKLLHAKVYSFTELGEMYNRAVSDYNEAIATCNGALRDSAWRQMDKVLREIRKKKDARNAEYQRMARNLIGIYQELTRFFDTPSDAAAFGKTIAEVVIGEIPLVGAAYTISNNLYSHASDVVDSQEGQEILERARQQADEMDYVAKEYKKHQDLGIEVENRKAELDARFREHCRGKDLGTWRYEDLGPGTADQSGVCDVDYSGNNQATGEVFTGRARNNTGESQNLRYPPGTILQPLDSGEDFQRMIIVEGPLVPLGPGEYREFPLGGFCLDPSSFPPPPVGPESPSWFPGEIPTIVPTGVPYNTFNREFSRIHTFPELIDQFLSEGLIPPTGLPPGMEGQTMTQWYAWNIINNFGPEDGQRKIEEQVEESGGSQTPQQIEQLNENIWTGIDLTKKRVRQGP